jgi:putative phosphoribosyl transferase
MRFKDRVDAGRQLGAQLRSVTDGSDTILLALPRGGVPVAFEVAQALGAPLDVLLARKLGVPGHEELAFGAVAAGGGVYLDQQIVRSARISPKEIEQIVERTRHQLQVRAAMYRESRPALSIRNMTVILVDDGIATGASMIAAARAVRALEPGRVVIATPVAPSSSRALLETEADSLMVLQTPADFQAVGQFYEDFDQTSDVEVVMLLHEAAKSCRNVAPQGEPSA